MVWQRPLPGIFIGEIDIIKLKKVYSISILYFDIGKGSDYLYHGQNQFVGVHTKDFLQVNTKEKETIVSRLPSDIFPEYILIRVNEFNKVALSPIEEWMSKLEGSLEGHMEGLLEGRLEGEEKKNLENAKRMKALGVSFEVIKQVTGQKISNDF